MNRFGQKQRPGLNNSSFEQDPRIRSKCSTPKRTDYFKNNKQTQFHRVNPNLNNSTSMPNQRTQTKQFNIPDNDMRIHMGSSFLKGREKNKNDSKYDFQKEMIKKVQSYNVVAGTLREYFKQTLIKDKNRNKTQILNTAIQIIKAYSRTQITSVSPAVNELINSMLDTLPISKNKVRKRLSKSSKISISNLNLGAKQKVKVNSSNFSHERQFSFTKDRHQEQKNLKVQIEQLQLNLFDLRKQSQILQRIKRQFQQMDEQDKQEYIQQLQQIVTNQQKLLQKLGGGD